MKALLNVSLLLVLTAACSQSPSPQLKSPSKGAKTDDASGSKDKSDDKDSGNQDSGDEGTSGKDPKDDESKDKPAPEILPALPLAAPQTINVLTLNVWTGGPSGLSKDIKTAAADIACLQEVDPSEALEAVNLLGSAYPSLVHTSNASIGYAIISKFPIVKRIGETDSRGGVGAVFQINSGVRMVMFCHHGNYTPYGPYQLGVDKLSVAAVVQSEKDQRGWQMEELLGMIRPTMGGVDSVFLAGDFNAPSHVDYDPPVPWPVSTAVHAEGFVDSWLEKHPEKQKNSACKFSQNDPGITWARLSEAEPEHCFDRIDFIYYSSEALTNKESKTMELEVSDHRAVRTVFEVTDKASGSKVSKPTPKKDMSNVERRPFLSWAKTEKAAKYALYLDKNSALNVAPIELKDNGYIAPLLEGNTTYYWRVDVTDTTGKVTKGDVWNFKTLQGLGLTLAKTSFAPGEKIVVEFDGGQDVTDWIGVLTYGDFGTSSWKYLNDSEQKPGSVVGKGKVNIVAPSKSGTYYIRGLRKNAYRDTDSIEIKVP